MVFRVSFRRFLNKLLRRPPPEEVFTQAKVFFSHKEYKFAYAYFKRAARGFSGENPEMELRSVISAATCATQLGFDNQAAHFHVQAVILNLRLNEASDVLYEAEKATKAILSSEDAKLDEICFILAIQYLLQIARGDLNRARKTASHPILKRKSTISVKINELDKLIQERTVQLHDYILDWDFLPEEFSEVLMKVKQVLQGYTTLQAELLPLKAKTIDIKESVPIHIDVSSTSRTIIKQISLRTGSKGAVIHRPQLDQGTNSVSINHPQNYLFQIEAHLPGNWTIGPCIISYEVENGFQFELQTDSIELFVNEPSAVVHCELRLDEITKDFEYNLVVELRNKGPGNVENLQVNLDIPDGFSITDGTKTKQLANFAPSQNFIFELALRADLTINMLKGREISANINHPNVDGTTRISI